MLSLPLPLALTARLLPVAVLASAGWALSSGPLAAAPATGGKSAQGSPGTQDAQSGSPGSASSANPAATAKAYATAPAPCGTLAKSTITSLVPGAKTAGKEIPSTDASIRRTCSWNALKGFDYRWLDVTFEITDSQAAAQKAYTQRTAEKSGGGAVPGIGDAGYSVVNLSTEDKQETREGVVLVRSSNALVSVTYNGSDFETKKAPGTDEINKGAIKAAREAVTALENGRKQS
ncbi:hypothetical protein [Streptomyces glomeratus]|uniref:DUF3558 domain-containing protein n=1 Tax=Streptomyces glomeratus TaxID=284452 RepID=A0ABP6L0X1_9ACTN|nr:hypothetical protein [Streptomyces glomeratus]MCF1511683.1 hypothetical protein [Streptomyces glomeratus]